MLMSLYEILKELIGDELYKEELTDQDREDIGKVVEKYGRKEIVNNYDKLDEYIKLNKDDLKVKDYVGDVFEKVVRDIQYVDDDDFDDEEDKKREIKRNEQKTYYRIIKLLDQELKEIDYDPVWADLEGIPTDINDD